MKKIITGITAAALMATAPAVAQASAAPAPTTEANLGKGGESAQFEDMGVGVWVLGAVVLGLAVWGIIELVDDDEDPVSP